MNEWDDMALMIFSDRGRGGGDGDVQPIHSIFSELEPIKAVKCSDIEACIDL